MVNSKNYRGKQNITDDFAGSRNEDMRIALRPAFFRSFKSSDRPALIRIMIRAIFRRSADIERIDGSRKSRTYGPRTIPVTSIPMILAVSTSGRLRP